MEETQERIVEDEIELQISEEDFNSYKRLDHFLNAKIPQFSRTFLKNLFVKGMIILAPGVEAKKLELKRLPPVGTKILVQIPPPLPSTAKAENIPLEILYEDEHLVFVNKPAGMVTHPAPGNYTGTLVNAILHHCPDLKGVGDQKRPGIVHRLDKGTSGVMVVAKTQKCHEGLVLLFSEHNIDRIYEALSEGVKMPSTGEIEATIGRSPHNRLKMAADVKNGKWAKTYYKVLNYYPKLTHLELKLETGRTHQIRVHLSQIIHAPILGDPLYSCPKEQLKKLGYPYTEFLASYPHPLLHAKKLALIHPITKEELSFVVEPPETFKQVLNCAIKSNI
jgi:23S rRNA pseudouridine1911/1915/1917 synthase